ncbi:hypothetical protein JB92DRAFT_3091862 [Gautieria morchelliformis]|nr:hypothetical protein JB92DRAFT_3091862 [Gautieria morchelliformis]
MEVRKNTVKYNGIDHSQGPRRPRLTGRDIAEAEYSTHTRITNASPNLRTTMNRNDNFHFPEDDTEHRKWDEGCPVSEEKLALASDGGGRTDFTDLVGLVEGSGLVELARGRGFGSKTKGGGKNKSVQVVSIANGVRAEELVAGLIGSCISGSTEDAALDVSEEEVKHVWERDRKDSQGGQGQTQRHHNHEG